MLRKSSVLVVLGLFFGCASEPSEPVDEVVQEATALPGALEEIAGTYTRKETSDATPWRLVLLTDRRYHLETPGCLIGPCAVHIDEGTFKLSRNATTGRTFIRFVPADGSPGGRYRYNLDGDELRIKPAGETALVFERDGQAWCGTVDDCALQQLAVPACVGNLSCLEHSCHFQCGSLGEIAP